MILVSGHDSADFAARLAAAEDWLSIAIDAQREGEWVLTDTDTERRVLADLVAATNHVDPSCLTRPVGMADMLSGIYALAEQGERWSALVPATAQTLNSAGHSQATRQERALEQAINDLHPRLAPDLSAAERFFTGPGSLEDLPQFFY